MYPFAEEKLPHNTHLLLSKPFPVFCPPQIYAVTHHDLWQHLPELTTPFPCSHPHPAVSFLSSLWSHCSFLCSGACSPLSPMLFLRPGLSLSSFQFQRWKGTFQIPSEVNLPLLTGMERTVTWATALGQITV